MLGNTSSDICGGVVMNVGTVVMGGVVMATEADFEALFLPLLDVDDDFLLEDMVDFPSELARFSSS